MDYPLPLHNRLRQNKKEKLIELNYQPFSLNSGVNELDSQLFF